MTIQAALAHYQSELQSTRAKLVAVSKTFPVEAIQSAYDAGQRCFGESKAQELSVKYDLLPKNIEWHFIGHLQSNKVKYVAPFVDTIHSVDSLKLLKIIHQEAFKNQRVIKVLLQMHIAKEENKFGMDEKELFELLNAPELKELKNIRIVGLMGIASNSTDEALVEAEYLGLSSLFSRLKATVFHGHEGRFFTELSMGMSGDYKLALRHGATMVRIGSAIFGQRVYQNSSSV
jgi:pyridoxal phosphate enzyme (YggS family)